VCTARRRWCILPFQCIKAMIHFPPAKPRTPIIPPVKAPQFDLEIPSVATTPVAAPTAPYTTPSLPSMIQMAKNVSASLARTAKQAATGQGVRVTKEEAERRLAICKTCQFFRLHDQRCSKCGCYMAVKTYLKAEKCPVGLWGS
jgi:hypothetical protein